MTTNATYGIGIYGESIYGQVSDYDYSDHFLFEGQPLGCQIRGQIGKKHIYRIRQGNGYAGSKVGRDYQDKFGYFVPSSITHPNGDNSRTTFAAAVQEWHLLSSSEKQQYNSAASRRGGLTGFNLFIQNYMEVNYG